jgi:predicted aconitase
MVKYCSILAAVFSLAAVTAARADGLRPIEGRTIDLGHVSGVVYYTVEHDGFRVVATFAEAEAGTPVRFEAVLAPGQSIVLSAPREVGIALYAIEIRRRGDQVLVQDATVTN